MKWRVRGGGRPRWTGWMMGRMIYKLSAVYGKNTLALALALALAAWALGLAWGITEAEGQAQCRRCSCLGTCSIGSQDSSPDLLLPCS